MQIFKVKVKPQIDRLDLFLVDQTKNLSRSKIQKLIEEGFVLVNKERVVAGYKLRKGDLITLNQPAPKPTEILPEKLNIKVVFEDDDLIVIEKEAGIVVHPTADHTQGTVVNWLLDHLGKSESDDLRFGIVHRLDKGTSGLLVIAKTTQALEGLKKQFAVRKVDKMYLALVMGRLEKPFGVIREPIGRHPKSFQKFAITGDGKPAETEYRVKREFSKFTLVEAFPKTGRTHQIRVHFASLKHPLVGDKLYGGKMLTKRPFLHAAYLKFKHPKTEEKLEFRSKLPEDLEVFLQKLDEKTK